jgi:hypothetical protein
METSRRYSYLFYLFLLLYPLGIVSAEFFQWVARRRNDTLAPSERAYQASRARRRLLLAACSASTVVLFWGGAENDFWWGEPTRFAAFVTAVIVSFAVAAVLRLVIRRAAAHYPVLVIRDLQLKQVQLQEEVAELQKRLHHLRYAGGLS